MCVHVWRDTKRAGGGGCTHTLMAQFPDDRCVRVVSEDSFTSFSILFCGSVGLCSCVLTATVSWKGNMLHANIS